MDHCRTCAVELVSTNWYPSFEKASNRQCKSCFTTANADARARYRVKLIEANPEGFRKREAERASERRRLFPEKERATLQRYLEKHGDRRKQLRKDWRTRNPTKDRLYASNRRMLKRCKLEKEDRDRIEKLYQLADLLTRITGAAYHVDHIKALSRGGQHHPDNMVVMRADYNLSKGAKTWVRLEQEFTKPS